jgi:hypothetical protein
MRGFPATSASSRYRIYRQSAEKLNRRYVLFGREFCNRELQSVATRYRLHPRALAAVFLYLAGNLRRIVHGRRLRIRRLCRRSPIRRSLHGMAQIIELDAAVVAMVESSAQKPLHHARECLYHRIDLVRRNPSRHLVGMASRALNQRGRFQRELPRCLSFNLAFPALQHLLIEETLVPSAVPACHSPAAFCANRHRECFHSIPSSVPTQP